MEPLLSRRQQRQAPIALPKGRDRRLLLGGGRHGDDDDERPLAPEEQQARDTLLASLVADGNTSLAVWKARMMLEPDVDTEEILTYCWEAAGGALAVAATTAPPGFMPSLPVVIHRKPDCLVTYTYYMDNYARAPPDYHVTPRSVLLQIRHIADNLHDELDGLLMCFPMERPA